MKTIVSTSLEEAALTGRLNHNSRAINTQAVRELVAHNPYWSLSLKAVETLELDFDEALDRLIASLGLTRAEFDEHDEGYINPERTEEQLRKGLGELFGAAATGATILLATGHPGSMTETYRLLGVELERAGGKLWRLGERTPTPGGRFLDELGGVIVLSDEGSLEHTHADEGLRQLMDDRRPDWVVSDHGYAAAAIDLGISTVAFFDSDDPALPLAATVCDNVIAIPMNDNQTNIKTATALKPHIMAAARA